MTQPHSRFNLIPVFFKLTTINVLSNLMVPLSGLIDVAFLGHLEEIYHLAGVSLATVIFNYLYWIFSFLRMSTTGLTAQSLGRQEHKAVLLIGIQHGFLAIGIGLLLLIVQIPLRELGFSVFSADPEVKASGEAFFNALIWGAPATLLNLVLIGWFLGRNQNGKVFLLSSINSGFNIVLDYWFIVELQWGSTGAGIATALSQYIMLIVGFGLIIWEIPLKQFWLLKDKWFELTALRTTLTLNIEILVRTFALISTMAIFMRISSSQGTAVLTTNAVLMQVVTLAAYFIDGVAFATESLAGLCRGRGTPQLLSQLVKVASGTSLVLGLLFALMFVFNPFPLFRLLTNHYEILDQLGYYVPWLLPVLGFGSLAYMLDGYFLGLTQGRLLRRSMLIAACFGFAPLAAIASYLNSSGWLWLSFSVFMAVRALTLGIEVPKTLEQKQC